MMSAISTVFLFAILSIGCVNSQDDQSPSNRLKEVELAAKVRNQIEAIIGEVYNLKTQFENQKGLFREKYDEWIRLEDQLEFEPMKMTWVSF